jgi:hypothetical protein
MSRTLGAEWCEKYVGWSGLERVTWLSIQYLTSVLPFRFTELLFQETWLLFKSPTISTESFWAKM